MAKESQQLFIDVYKNSKSVTETTEFAIGMLNTKLSLQQKRIFYWVFSMVTADENPNALYKYNISISEMASIIGTRPSSLKCNMAKVVDQMDILELNYNPPMLMDTDDGRIVDKSFGIFDQLWIDKDDPDTIKIILTTGFRRKVIAMKKRYDLEFPLHTILQMSSPYAIDLYTLLISEAALQRDKSLQEGKLENSFVIKISKDKLFDFLNYKGRTSDFNNVIIPTILKNLCNTEILLDSEDPYIERKGNSVVSYTFHVRVNTTREKKIFAKSVMSYSIESGLPKMEYLLDKLKEIGVGKSLLKKCRAENDRNRLWGNYLYTLYCVGPQAKYFNAAYNNNYLESVGGNASMMFKIFINEPECRRYWKDDELMQCMKDESDSSELGFYDELRKQIALAEEKRKMRD